jgi:nucleotide-binding universal stress UspA family protein
LRLAADIARQHSARLTVLHVDGLPSYSDQLPQFAPDQTWGDYLARHDHALEERLGEFARPLEFEGDIEFALTRGEAAPAVVDYAREHACDLVVISPRGAGYGQQFLLGSVSAEVASDAHCPILVARSRAGLVSPRSGFIDPLVAISDVELGRRALERTAGLAEPRTRIELLHVLESCEIAIGPPLPGGFHEAVAKSRREVESRLERLSEPMRHAGFSTSVRVETGDPSFSILCRAETNSNGLLVVSRKTRATGRSSLSTAAYRMVKHAPVPVLVVPGPG